jgi:hypothetical protein
VDATFGLAVKFLKPPILGGEVVVAETVVKLMQSGSCFVFASVEIIGQTARG